MMSLLGVVLSHPIWFGLASFVIALWGLYVLEQKQGSIRLLGWVAVVVGLPVLLLCCGLFLLAGI